MQQNIGNLQDINKVIQDVTDQHIALSRQFSILPTFCAFERSINRNNFKPTFNPINVFPVPGGPWIIANSLVSAICSALNWESSRSRCSAEGQEDSSRSDTEVPLKQNRKNSSNWDKFCKRGWQMVYTWRLIKAKINMWRVYFTEWQVWFVPWNIRHQRIISFILWKPHSLGTLYNSPPPLPPTFLGYS